MGEGGKKWTRTVQRGGGYENTVAYVGNEQVRTVKKSEKSENTVPHDLRRGSVMQQYEKLKLTGIDDENKNPEHLNELLGAMKDVLELDQDDTPADIYEELKTLKRECEKHNDR